MRYELDDHEWAAINPMLPEKLIKIGSQGRVPWPLRHFPDARGRGAERNCSRKSCG
jgi:transposase